MDQAFLETKRANLTGLAVSGKILLPIQKTEKQRENAKVTAKGAEHAPGGSQEWR